MPKTNGRILDDHSSEITDKRDAQGRKKLKCQCPERDCRDWTVESMQDIIGRHFFLCRGCGLAWILYVDADGTVSGNSYWR